MNNCVKVFALQVVWIFACDGVSFPGTDSVDLDGTISGDAGVIFPDGDLGDNAALLFRGTVVTPDQVIQQGEVLAKEGKLICVASSCSEEEIAHNAIVVQTSGIIFPGLIDSHNHTEYNYLPVWENSKKYTNHSQWQGSTEYKNVVSAPHGEMKDPSGTDGNGTCETNEDCYTGRCLQNKCENVLCEMIKYGEIRALIAGATTIQGTALRKCADTLIRNADLPYHGLDGGDTVRTSVLGVYNISNPQKLVEDLKNKVATAFIIHLGEGIDEDARSEFDALESLGLLLPQVTIIHGTALGEAELAKIKDAQMKMVWSPSSNIALYGQTNDIVSVWNLGISFSLAPDWTPSGEADLLGELKIAWQMNKTQLSEIWSAKELVQMVTTKAAKTVGFENEIGKLENGMRADLLVIDGDLNNPYESLINAKLSQVRLVVVGGKAIYGDPLLMTQLAPNSYCESVSICGSSKTLCVKESENDENKFNQTLTDIETALNRAYTPGILPLSLCE